MPLRAEIEWLAEDTFVKVGCLRIGDENFSHRRYDEFTRSCTVHADMGKWRGDDPNVIEVKGWDNPQYGHWILNLLARLLCLVGLMDERGITEDHWRAMEACFLREEIDHYQFSRAEGPRWKKELHWVAKYYDHDRQRWRKDVKRLAELSPPKRVNEAA